MSYTKFVVNSGTGYSTANNIPMAIGLHIPTPNSSGTKPALWIWLHGIGERGSRGNLGAGGIDIVPNYGTPKLIRAAGAEIPAYFPPRGIATIKHAVMFAQCSSEYGTWPMAYPDTCINYAYANLANQVDLNRIYLIGHSLGGGGVLQAYGFQSIHTRVAAFFAIAPGYIAATNYLQMAQWGAPLYVYHHIADALAPISVADTFIRNLNAQRPATPSQYYRLNANTGSVLAHDWIREVVSIDLTENRNISQSNADQWFTYPNIYKAGLIYSLPRLQRGA